MQVGGNIGHSSLAIYNETQNSGVLGEHFAYSEMKIQHDDEDAYHSQELQRLKENKANLVK